jgi:hypothetical protein
LASTLTTVPLRRGWNRGGVGVVVITPAGVVVVGVVLVGVVVVVVGVVLVGVVVVVVGVVLVGVVVVVVPPGGAPPLGPLGRPTAPLGDPLDGWASVDARAGQSIAGHTEDGAAIGKVPEAGRYLLSRTCTRPP